VRRAAWALLGAAALGAAAGCTADAGATGGSGGASGSGGNTPGSGGVAGPGSGGAGSGSGGDAGTGSGGSSTITLSCKAPANGSPVLRLLTRSELQNTLGDVFPEVKSQWTSSLPAGNVTDLGFDNDQGATVGSQLAASVLDTAQSVATAVTGSALANLLPCSTSAADRACAETFLKKYGPRLFRRAVTTDEHDKYLSFFDSAKGKSDFKTALKWMTVALIQSPNTLYRSEIGADMGNGTRKLTAYEQASELAYMYTGTAPSESLLSTAASGNLGDPVAVDKSLLQTDAGKQMLQRFFEQYLDYASVTSVSKANVQTFSQLSGDMVKETHAFIDDVIVQKGGGLKELLTATTTNPSKALAAFYATGNAYSGGFPMPSSDYASVQRPKGLGIGVLAQGAFLANHASSVASSPTKRGLFPYRRLFCQPKLSPPPNVPALDTTSQMANIHTTRDRYELQHQLLQGANGPCASCHKLFDPIGFAFEHFDEVGRYRAKEGSYDINSTASLAGPSGTLSFTDQESLMNALVGEPVIHECMAAYLATYAFGSSDACIGSSQVPDLQAGKIGVVEAFARLAREPHFSQRDAN
jgi:hypothetical protein